MPINPLGYSCIKKLQRDNLWHAYNEPINFYSVGGQVAMRRAVAAWRCLLICQNLGGVRPPPPLTPHFRHP